MGVICAYVPPFSVFAKALAGEAPILEPRQRTRTLIAGHLLLSVPIEGGANAVKHTAPEEWVVSAHGRWPHVHFEALRAAYGRTPYWAHLAPMIEPIITCAPGHKFSGLTSRLNEMILRFLKWYDVGNELSELRRINPLHYSALREERLRRIDKEQTILAALFELGPEAIFSLCGAL